MKHAISRLLFAALLMVSVASPRVLRVEVEVRQPVLDGRQFGDAGAYESIRGKVFFAVDPANPANAAIRDLEFAPRNANGEVEFSSDFHLLWPSDPAKANRALICEINNRGGKGMLSFFHRATGSTNPQAAEHFGDGFLMNRGFALLWVGWQFDVPRREGLMRVNVPVAKNPDGSSIRGLVRADFSVTDTTFSHLLSDREHIAYPVADPASPLNVLTVRDTREGSRTVVPRERWRFANWEGGSAVEDPTRVYLEGGFQPQKIYEVVYVAENPPVVGLGMAAVRDMIAHLKFAEDSTLGLKPGRINRAHGFGISQSGRFLRTFLYFGMNVDEQERRVFDGVMAHVAGGGRGSFNHRFAQPSRDGHPYLNFFYPTDIFPFSDVPQRDLETGRRDGILMSYENREQLLPKIFYTNSSYEYWGRAASQIHTTVDGSADIAVPASTRIYHFAGTQHGPGPWPPRRSGTQQLGNPNNIRWGMRALMLAMDDWVANGTEPPPSRYPRIDKGTLTPPEDLAWPKIPGVNTSTEIHKAYRADYGPRFISSGIVEKQPPAIGKPFPLRVPQVDADGNELNGIRLPEVAAPLATLTGWNLFDAKSGPPQLLSNMIGSYIPFPRTSESAMASGDPRKPIAVRYADREDYLQQVRSASETLAAERLVIPGDIPDILREAAARWDWQAAR